MKLERRFRGKKELLARLRHRKYHRTVLLENTDCDGRKASFRAKVPAEDMLDMAKDLVAAFGEIAGVEYGVFVRTKPVGDPWRKI